MKKILIFGIDSFTGNHLQKYFENNGLSVFGTVLHRKVDDDKYFECDITKKKSIQNVLQKIEPDFIINLAAISYVGYERKDVFYKVNALAVESILESVLELTNKPEKIILCSSATVYGNQDKSILDESLCPNPVNHYGISKLAMEQVAKAYFTKLNIIVTRPFNYTGVGQSETFLIPKIVSHYKKKAKKIELGNIDVFREFNDVEYVCEIYRKLLVTPVSGEIVNIASNRKIALKEVIHMMDDIAGYNIKVKINPQYVRKNEIVSLTGSTDKLFKMIGKIEQKDFKKTLKEMYDG